MEKALKDAILKGLNKQIIPGKVDTVDNIYSELEPIIQAIINASMDTAIKEVEKALNAVENRINESK